MAIAQLNLSRLQHTAMTMASIRTQVLAAKFPDLTHSSLISAQFDRDFKEQDAPLMSRTAQQQAQARVDALMVSLEIAALDVTALILWLGQFSLISDYPGVIYDKKWVLAHLLTSTLVQEPPQLSSHWAEVEVWVALQTITHFMNTGTFGSLPNILAPLPH